MDQEILETLDWQKLEDHIQNRKFMRKILLITTILLMSTKCYAENWVCYNALTNHITRSVNGDCTSLGICAGPNNQGIIPNCFEATETEYIKSKERFVKFNRLGAVGNRVIDMTAQEIQDILDAEAAAIRQQKLDQIENLEVSTSELLRALIDLSVVNEINLKERLRINSGVNSIIP